MPNISTGARAHRTPPLLLPSMVAILALGALPAWPNGTEEHLQPKPAHMQAMRSVKNSIPDQFREIRQAPVPASPENLAAGAALFREYCAVCHGEEGRGDGPASASLEPRPADFHNREHSAMYGPGEKYWLIGNGAATTGMPAFGDRLDDQQRWYLVLHILSLQSPVE